MTRQKLLSAAVTFAIASLPAVAAAQGRTSNGDTTGTAVPRSDSGSGTAAPSGGGAAGGGGGSTGGSMGSSGSSTWTPPSSSSPSSWSAPEPPVRYSDQSSRSRSGGESTGTATSRSGGGSSGGGRSASAPRSGGSSGDNASSRSGDGDSPRRAVPVYSRPRDGRAVTGEAAVRTAPPSGGGGGGNIIYYPYYPYYPWGYWGAGYGFGLGYLAFDPFYCNWGYGYDCGYNYGYGYGGGGYGGGGYGGGGGGYSVSKESKEQGSLRLKIDPKQAEVFVDGYYVGIVDSYDGSFQKLELDAGAHKIELKAQGYEPIEFEVLIPVGDTVIYKGGLKRIK